jgi:hypothetical protein
MKFRKSFFFILLICLLSVLGYNSISIFAEPTTVPQEQKKLQQLAENFLNNHYTSLLTNSYQRCDFIKDNDNAYLWDGYIKSRIESTKILWGGMHSYEHKISSTKFNIEKNKAIVDLKVHVEYVYNTLYNENPKDLPTSGYICFNFEFEKNNDQWLINNVKTNDDYFKMFQKIVVNKIEKLNEDAVNQDIDSLTYRQVIDATVQANNSKR